jgi:hypothetical protein
MYVDNSLDDMGDHVLDFPAGSVLGLKVDRVGTNIRVNNSSHTWNCRYNTIPILVVS